MSVPADETAAPPPPPPAPPMTRTLPLEFQATGSEYFRIWIVNLLLSIVTLGIYSAWAKVRRLRYFYGNTLLDGHSFEYHGRPLAILKGRLIAFGAYAIFVVLTQLFPLSAVLFLPLILFGVPWIIQRSRLFQMRMSSYRGLRFNFHGTYGGALGAYIGWALLAAITIYLLLPMFLWKRINYLLNNSSYGTEKFRFTTLAGRFFGFVYASLGMLIALFAGIGIVVASMSGAMRSAGGDPAAAMAAGMGAAFLLLALTALALGLGIAGYFQKSLLNASFGGLELGPHRLQSTLRTWPLVGILVSNVLLMIVTLGLFYPWAKVRQMRYQFANLSLLAQGDLDQFRAAAGPATDAIGEEIGDFFDIDFGL